MKNQISLKNFKSFVDAVLNYLEFKKAHQILFHFTSVSSTHGTAMVNAVLKNNMKRIVHLNLENFLSHKGY